MLLTLALQVENLCQSSGCQTVPKAAVARQTVATKGASSGRSRKPQKSASATKKRERRRWRFSRAAHVETVLLAATYDGTGASGRGWRSLRIPLVAGYLGSMRLERPASRASGGSLWEALAVRPELPRSGGILTPRPRVLRSEAPALLGERLSQLGGTASGTSRPSSVTHSSSTSKTAVFSVSVKVTLELALTETAIVSSAACAAGTPRRRSRSSAASWSSKVTIPRLVRIFSTSTRPPGDQGKSSGKSLECVQGASPGDEHPAHEQPDGNPEQER